MNKNIWGLITLTAIISHVCSAEFECTWNEYKGPLYSMVTGQKPHITDQAWPLMHKTITADNAEKAKSLCRTYVLENNFNNDKQRFEKNTKNWDAKLMPESESEWHCKSQGATSLKIVATS